MTKPTAFAFGPDDPDTALEDLKRGAIHVWHLRFEPVATRVSAMPRSTRSGTLLREFIGYYLRTPIERISLEFGPHGKPRLAGNPQDCGLVFNLSHSAARLAIALAFDRRLGVDIEAWRPLRNSTALASRCLAASEFDAWSRLTEVDQPGAFFELWTLKEAYCKAVGRGLALGIRDCVFDWIKDSPQLIRSPLDGIADAASWYFHRFPRRSGMSGALASDRPCSAVRHFGRDISQAFDIES